MKRRRQTQEGEETGTKREEGRHNKERSQAQEGEETGTKREGGRHNKGRRKEEEGEEAGRRRGGGRYKTSCYLLGSRGAKLQFLALKLFQVVAKVVGKTQL